MIIVFKNIYFLFFFQYYLVMIMFGTVISLDIYWIFIITLSKSFCNLKPIPITRIPYQRELERSLSY